MEFLVDKNRITKPKKDQGAWNIANNRAAKIIYLAVSDLILVHSRDSWKILLVYTLNLKKFPVWIISENYATNIFGVDWQSVYKSNKICCKSSWEAKLAFKIRHVNCLHFKFIAQKLLSCNTCNRNNNKKEQKLILKKNHLQNSRCAYFQERRCSFFLCKGWGGGGEEGKLC